MTIYEKLPENQQALIKQHLDLVIQANEKTNLTRITTFEEAMILHVEDSLTALPEMNEAPNGPYGDLGSGAGYPGIPLAIATDRKTTLIDARQKKMRVLDNIINELGLSDQITTYAGRAELLARTQPNHYAVLTARALAKLPVLMELASPLLQKDGILICYKANVENIELAQAKQVQPLTGLTLQSIRQFQLATEYTRTILTFQKTITPTVKLPRQEGQAQKHPLCE